MQHYKTLGIAPTASLAEIKKAYRQLVHQYHPDKAENNEKEAQFLAVQEAYEILSNAAKRQVYDIQYFSSRTKENKILTEPAELLKKLIQLERKLHGQDPYRMNKDNLYFELSYFFSDENMNLIKKEVELAETYLDLSLKCLSFIPFKVQESFISNLLSNYSKNNQSLKIQLFYRKQKLSYYWNKYKFLLVLLAVCAICWWVANK